MQKGNIPRAKHDEAFAESHHRSSLAVQRAKKYRLAVTAINAHANILGMIDTHLSSSPNQSPPFHLRQKTPQKFSIKLRLSELDLSVFEDKREVIRIAVLDMAS